MIYVFFTPVALAAFGYFLYQLYRWMGENQIGFTFMDGGTGRVIVVGKGQPVKFLVNLPGYDVNDPHNPDQHDKNFPDWQIIPTSHFKAYRDENFLKKRLGIWLIHWWPFNFVYEYKFSWVEFRQPAGQNEYTTRSREETTKIFMAQNFPYFSEVTDFYISGNAVFSLPYAVNLAITNPMIALFGNEDWLATALFALNERAKDWAGGQSLEQLLSEADDVKGSIKESFDEWMKEINKFLIEKVGVELKSANFLKLVDRNEAAGAMRQAIQAVFIAQRSADASAFDATRIKISACRRRR